MKRCQPIPARCTSLPKCFVVVAWATSWNRPWAIQLASPLSAWFRIDGAAPPAVGNRLTIDNGGMVTVMWTPVSAPDFAGYRIYRNTVWPARDGVRRDKAVDATLGLVLTSGTTLNGLDPAQNYYLNIVTVDAVGNERPLANDIILYRRAPGAAATVTYLQGNATGSGEVYAGESWPLAVRLTDATGLPAPGENVTFTVTAGAGALAGGAAKSKRSSKRPASYSEGRLRWLSLPSHFSDSLPSEACQLK